MTQLTLRPPGASLRSVHPEDSTEHAQEQGHLQEDQQQEADAAEQGPMVLAGICSFLPCCAGPGGCWQGRGRTWGACEDLRGGGCWQHRHLNLEGGVT